LMSGARRGRGPGSSTCPIASEESSGCPNTARSDKQKKGPVVLVADDEKAMRDSCALVLGREGLEVVTASEGKAALETLGHRLPDVIIVDLKMPGMSGEEFLTRAKEIDPDLVAIAITGYATLGSAVDAMKAGAYDFLPKPFRAEELRLIVRRALEKRRLSLIAAEAEREKRRMRDLFVAVVSHQLKSPAASLKECLDAVLSQHETDMPGQCRDLILRATAKAGLLLRLMDDWLTLSRLESGGIKRNAGWVDVAELVQQALAQVKEAHMNRRVAIESRLGFAPVRVRGDGEALRELFINLTDNAIRYTPDGGKVLVKVAGEAGGAVVSVTDDGPGIDAEELDLIFSPFFRGAAAKKQPGTGLGLAIVKQIAEAHGGRVTVQSRVCGTGRGSTFKLYLPTDGGEPCRCGS